MTTPQTPRITEIENARQRRQDEARAVADLAGHSMDYYRLPHALKAIVDAYHYADVMFLEASEAARSSAGVDGVDTEQWAMLTELERLAYHTRAELERHGVVEGALAWLAAHPVGWDDEPEPAPNEIADSCPNCHGALTSTSTPRIARCLSCGGWVDFRRPQVRFWRNFPNDAMTPLDELGEPDDQAERYPEQPTAEQSEITKMRQLLWIKDWPHYCRECSGAGAFHSPGSLYEPPSDEPCQACTARGVCARCGHKGLTDDGDGPCAVCNWNYDDFLTAE